ncbi:3-keto-disaccharide hydrolase [Shewanella gaetbuli]|uniref:DUF1080 domain-containing protein n=1 Tax=Shewanella gaetbuli TaxID=220752 RepID=A0A9X1ZN03_9GAMM|nr:DUF1080 domain-containing protein [Shewanella gaetbuli]MCL1142890.1 DUF1080 domain-containing protein [Shewanella gaetbuli]
MNKNKMLLLRSILLIPLLSISSTSFAQDNLLSETERQAGWSLLFNGKDMSQWRSFKQQDVNPQWQVKNGAMVLTAKGGGDLISKQCYKNFDLMLEWKISLAGNSGIFIMADEAGDYIYSHAPEVQIIDNERHSDTEIDSHLSGSIYDLIASPADSHKPAGQWNQARIKLVNNQLNVWQNNVLTTDILINSPEWKQLVQQSKFKNWKGFSTNEGCQIGLQDHGDEVAFKNIKIKAL